MRNSRRLFIAILNLIVLCCCLCNAAEKQKTAENTAKEHLYTYKQILQEKEPHKYQLVKLIEPENSFGYVLTVHSPRDFRYLGGEKQFPWRLALYSRNSSAANGESNSEKYRLLLEYVSNGDYIEQATFFQMPHKDKAEKTAHTKLLLRFRDSSFGTGHFGEYHYFAVSAKSVQEIDYTPASVSYTEAKKLAKGEGIWQDGIDFIRTEEPGRDELRYRFFIWKEGDGNCCPSAGKVTGSYTLQQNKTGTLHIKADSFLREAVPTECDK